MLRTEVKLLDSRLKDLLTFGSAMAAGMDLRACGVSQITGQPAKVTLNDDCPSYTLYPGEKVLVGSGIAVYLASTCYVDDYGFASDAFVDGDVCMAAFILPRSGLGTKLDIRLANTVGLIDADYQGEILIAVRNGGTNPFEIQALDRLAQMVVVPVVRPVYHVVESFSVLSARGAGGFGSTGSN